jgi:hypothetical protein
MYYNYWKQQYTTLPFDVYCQEPIDMPLNAIG